MKQWLLLIIIPVLLCACDPGLQQGYITAKHYYAPYYSYDPGYWTKHCFYDTDDERQCYSIYQPGMQVYNDAEYALDLSSCKRNTGSSECKNNTIYVDRHDYDVSSVGAYYGSQ